MQDIYIYVRKKSNEGNTRVIDQRENIYSHRQFVVVVTRQRILMLRLRDRASNKID